MILGMGERSGEESGVVYNEGGSKRIRVVIMK